MRAIIVAIFLLVCSIASAQTWTPGQAFNEAYGNDLWVIATTPSNFSQQLSYRGTYYEVRGALHNPYSYARRVDLVSWSFTTGPSWLGNPCAVYGCTLHLCANNDAAGTGQCTAITPAGGSSSQTIMNGSTSGLYNYRVPAYTWIRWTLTITVNGSGWIGQPVTDYTVDIDFL